MRRQTMAGSRSPGYVVACAFALLAVTKNLYSSTSKGFAAAVALLACIYNALLAASCAYLPDDPLSIRSSISLYAWAGSVLSILGLAGIVLVRKLLL